MADLTPDTCSHSATATTLGINGSRMYIADVVRCILCGSTKEKGQEWVAADSGDGVVDDLPPVVEAGQQLWMSGVVDGGELSATDLAGDQGGVESPQDEDVFVEGHGATVGPDGGSVSESAEVGGSRLSADLTPETLAYFAGVAESYKADEDWGDVTHHVIALQAALAAEKAAREAQIERTRIANETTDVVSAKVTELVHACEQLKEDLRREKAAREEWERAANRYADQFEAERDRATERAEAEKARADKAEQERGEAERRARDLTEDSLRLQNRVVVAEKHRAHARDDARKTRELWMEDKARVAALEAKVWPDPFPPSRFHRVGERVVIASSGARRFGTVTEFRTHLQAKEYVYVLIDGEQEARAINPDVLASAEKGSGS